MLHGKKVKMMLDSFRIFLDEKRENVDYVIEKIVEEASLSPDFFHEALEKEILGFKRKYSDTVVL